MLWIVDTSGRIIGGVDRDWGAVLDQIGGAGRDRSLDHGRYVRIDYDDDGTRRIGQLFKLHVVELRTAAGGRMQPAYFLVAPDDMDPAVLRFAPFIDLRQTWAKP